MLRTTCEKATRTGTTGYGKLMNLNFQAQQLQAAKNSFAAELNASFKEDKKDDKDA